MTRPQRRAHRLFWFILLPVFCLLFLIGARLQGTRAIVDNSQFEVADR